MSDEPSVSTAHHVFTDDATSTIVNLTLVVHKNPPDLGYHSLLAEALAHRNRTSVIVGSSDGGLLTRREYLILDVANAMEEWDALGYEVEHTDV